jgi:uncharacterized glyoxalase superfamily protein PhnB
MSQAISRITPNLIVRDVLRSVEFYRDVLGFELGMSVPDAPPFVFAGMKSGEVFIFLNDPHAAEEELPLMAGRPIGGTLTLYIEVTGIDALFDRLRSRAPVVMSIRTQFYGMREFAITDPDGWVLTFAERVAGAA